MAKRAAAGTLALAVCLTGGAALASSAQAATGFKFDTRLAGADRYLTAVEASKAAFPDGSDSVVLVNGDRTVDGLTASYVAGLHNAPILYVNSDGNTVSTETAAEVLRLKATKAYIVGGTTVVSAALEAKLGSTGGTVVRYGGTDRYETAAKVAKSGTDTPSKVLVASGERFADALVVGPEAFQQHYPILLTSSTGVPSYTAAALKSIAAKDVKVIGGTAVVSDSTFTAVGGTIRLADDNRQGTAVKVAADAIANEGFSKASIGLVGNFDKNAADALVAAPLAGKNKTPLLFIDAGITGAPTATYLKAHAADLTGKGYVFGGTTAVPQADVDDATSAAVGVTAAVGAYTITSDAATQATQTSRTYTVGGLTVGKAVRIALVNPTQVSSGNFTLVSTGAAGNRLAGLAFSGSASDIVIDQINGVTIPTGVATSFTPSGTSITFRVTSLTSTGTTATPVVFEDNSAHSLAANLNGTPTTQAFGVGGTVTFAAAAAAALPEASSASIASAAVQHVYGASGFDQAASPTTQYLLRDGDTYKYAGTVITKAQFLSILSAGDTLSGTYVKGSTSSNPSTFEITADVALTAAQPAVSSKGSTVTVTWTPDNSWSVGGTTYTLARAQVVSGVQGSFSTVKTAAVGSLAQQTFTETLADGTYVYKLTATAPAFTSTAAVSSTVGSGTTATVSTAATVAAPAVQRVYLTSNATDVNHLNKGDVFKVVLNSAVTAPIQGSTLTVGGTTVTYAAVSSTQSAGDATFSVNSGAEVVDGVSHPAGTVLTVTLLADPTASVAFGGSTTVSAATGIANSAGSLTTITADNLLSQDVTS